MVVMRLVTLPALAAATVLALSGCTNPAGQDAGESGAAPTGSAAASTPAADSTASGAPGAVSAEDRQRAGDIVAEMDDDELAGSVIMADYQGTDSAAGAKLVKDNHLAGIIVMGYNLSQSPTADEVKKTTGALREAAGDRGWATAISVDQEGGPVARLGDAATRFPPLMAAGAADKPKITQAATRAQGAELRDLGFTADFAPDADVTIGKRDAAINVRSAGSSPALVARTAAAAVHGYTAGGIASSAKHYPGHGALETDSHKSLPTSKKSLAQMKKRDLVPFRATTKAGAPMVLVGHIGLPGSGTAPASLNPKVYASLRKDTGFDGVAVTDALNMGAISESPGQETVKAIRAGADLALMPPDPAAAVRAVRTALGSGDLTKARVTQAAERVVAMQLWQQRASVAGQAHPAEGDKAFTDLADASLTVLKGTCRVKRPAAAISVSGGEEAARTALLKAAEDEGLRTGSGTTVSLSPQGSAQVVVGTGGPWRVAGASAQTVLNTYSDNPHAMRAVAKYLAGTLTASAKAPVKTAGSPPAC